MVFFPKLVSAAVLLVASISSVAADLTITNPSASAWWVAKSQNLIAWTCQDSPFSNFTVLVGNVDPTIYPNQAVIAIQENFQCSILITQDQANQGVGTGWIVSFANPFNITDIYASSEQFEIKPLGSAYPAQVTPSSAIANSSASVSSTSAQTSPTSGAVSVTSTMWALVGAGVGALALVGWA